MWLVERYKHAALHAGLRAASVHDFNFTVSSLDGKSNAGVSITSKIIQPLEGLLGAAQRDCQEGIRSHALVLVLMQLGCVRAATVTTFPMMGASWGSLICQPSIMFRTCLSLLM